MSTKRAAPPPLICVNCGDELVIVAHYLPSGPLCADCVPATDVLEAPASHKSTETEVSTPQATESKGDSTAEDPGDRLATLYGLPVVYGTFPPPTPDPLDFRPEPGAQGLAIEVEEWVWIGGVTEEGDLVRGTRYPLATPSDLSLPEMSLLTAWSDLPTYSRFVVVLEWERAAGGPTLRDIGPTYGGDRQAALAGAMGFARAQAKRLKANGPFGYKPAREIPEVVRHATAQEAPVASDETAPDGESEARSSTMSQADGSGE